MIKMLKKIILLSLLITNLFKKLTVGLTLFLYNRTLGTRMGVIMGVAGLAMLLVVSTFIFMPKNFAHEDDVDARMQATQMVPKKEISFDAAEEATEVTEEMEAFDLGITEDYLAQGESTGTIDEIEAHLENAGAFSFQATEYSQGGQIGRSEPFMPVRPPGDSMMIPDIGDDTSGLSPEELARREAEQRRNEIRDRIHGDITVKGIVLGSDHTDPMAILEVAQSDGTIKVSTFKEGDVINLTSVQGTISEITDYVIKVTAEDVTEEKHLPQFEDEDMNIVPVSDTGADEAASAPPTEEGLMPPPAPGPGKFPTPPGIKSTKPSSIGDAKKKIEEIDKLLDSF